MNCEQCDLHLSGLIDGELAEPVRGAVESHLQDCQSCRQSLEDLRLVDRRLAGLRLPENGIARTAAAVSVKVDVAPQTSGTRFARRLLPWTVIAFVAASIALAFVVVEQQPQDEPQGEPPAIAQLVRTTGTVEIRKPGSNQWRRVEADDDIRLQRGTSVRTLPGVVCEIETADRSKLRLDGSAELILHQPSHVQVVKGQVWSRSSGSKPLQVDANSPNSAPQRLLTMTCPSNSEFQWTVDEQESVCHSLSERETQWDNQDFQCAVGPGERVAVNSNQNIQRSKQDATATKIWQLPLLAISQTDQELEGVLESVLVGIGSTKAGYLYERQIRQLGPPGAIPLLAYVQSDKSKQQMSVRRNSMRIASETADDSALDRLRQLRTDDDPVIAKLAGQAIERLLIPKSN